ncbi:iron uptake transporter permease EfeU [Paracoccus sp. (in: a-proteobacteria)]|uniref:iron uptake transporter permease EfeU n=1 Tax=Paracoccus sp. TaxID=267 RepID=UPI003A8C75EA
MLAPFLIMLREGLEAALIVGIIASYLHKTGRAAWMPAVWAGVFFAAAAALFAGAGIQLLAADFPQRAQELFEALIGVVAVVILTWMVFWMRRAARSIKGELQGQVDAALASDATGWALTGMAFLAVAREGLESVFFLLAVFQQSTGPAAPAGALAGLLVSVIIGWLIFRCGLRLDLRKFFLWTGIFILFVAAGILAGTLRNLHEAGVWNSLQGVVWDSSLILPVSSVVGTILSGIFGYLDTPTIAEVAVYALYLSVVMFFFLRPVKAVAHA